MIKVGLIGWRGMVGSVLLERMQAENDFDQNIDIVFFSTSQAGKLAPNVQNNPTHLQDAFDVKALKQCNILVTCQGSSYTNKVFPALKQGKWQGYWLDAASALRNDEKSIIALDPINGETIQNSLKSGIKQYIGGNCTVSLMLMAIGGLAKHIKSINVSTYQAFSGAGAKMIQTFFSQIKTLGQTLDQCDDLPFLEKEKALRKHLQTPAYTSDYNWSLVGNLCPWIDQGLTDGFTKEEYKGVLETNKILGRQNNPITVDSTCVRVGSIRSHAQTLHIELTSELDLETITQAIENTSPWTKVIENTPAATQEQLNPLCVSGSLNVHVGRIRKLNKANHIGVFTVGDQLLWGAAEPIRRTLNIVLDFLNA